MDALPPQQRALTAQARNRRLAYVAVLEEQGYFSAESMRLRAPLLYATYVGRYDAEQAAPDPETGGQHWVSEALLRRADDADADARLKRDLHRMEAQEFDSESDERVDDGAASGVQDVEGDEAHLGTHMDRLVELRELMVARFLGGMDAGIDYSIVDADAALDAAWEKVRDQDREDQYFDRDD